MDEVHLAAGSSDADGSPSAAQPSDRQPAAPGPQPAAPRSLAVRLTAALTLVMLARALMNDSIFPGFDAVLPEGREVWTYCGTLTYFAIALIAYFKPHLLAERLWTAGSFGVLVVGLTCLAFGVGSRSAALVFAGSVLAGMGGAWFFVLSGLAFVRLSSDARLASLMTAGCAYALVCAALYFVEVAVPAALLGYALCMACAYALMQRHAHDIVLVARRGSVPSEANVTNPLSFIPPFHAVYVSILLFNIANGCALTFCSVDSVPANPPLACVPALVLFAVVVVARRRVDADALFTVSLLLALAGFMLVPLAVEGSDPLYLTNAFLRAGSNCFNLLVILLMASIGSRNELSAVLLFALSWAMRGLGISVGTALGHLANALTGTDLTTVLAVSGIVAFVFVAYNFVMLRTFSFEKTIAGVRPVENVSVRAADGEEGGGADDGPCADEPDRSRTVFEECCADVAQAFRLTRRETEVFLLLAQGRSSPVIEERLVVSRNTVKTHVRNIYAKLGVHSQQELIDVVEAALAQRG